jgi:hypothetical protein
MSASQRPLIYAFNRGRVSPLSLARVDQKRVALGADVMTNYLPRVLGPMTLRPGWQYIGATASNNQAVYMDFVFSTTDTALVELTNQLLRVWVNDSLVTRVAVSTTVANGNFDANLTSWADADEAGGSSVWVAGGYMGLTGNGTAAAIRTQTLAIAGADQNVEHALRIVINKGPVTFRLGSSAGGDEYINEATLGTGTHSLAFTPTGANAYIQFSSRLKRQVLVDSCNVEAAGVMTLPTPWVTADISKVRKDQSGDILFCAAYGYQQRKIERRATHSWSIVLYEPEDGPFDTQNVGPITISASALTGSITLTASAALFYSTQVNSLVRLTSTGQVVSADVVAENNFTDAITVTGVGTARSFTLSITNVWVATVELQRSFDGGATWIDVAGYTANIATTYSDGLDNQSVQYRIGVKTGDFTSGTVSLTLSYPLGSITGVARITAYTNKTTVTADVLTTLGGTASTLLWSFGSWSDRSGWPSTVRFHQGRLWWSGKNGVWGSISDAFDAFDPDFEGDAGPINRTIGSGPVDNINWLISIQRLMLGAQGSEFTVKASSLDEPITPTNFNCKASSSQGSASIDAAQFDQRGVFVQRGGIKIYELGPDPNNYDYITKDLTVLVPEMGSPGIVKIAIQRQPDTRVHAIRSDGTVMLGVIDEAEQVIAWVDVTTNGVVENVVVLPGQNGSTEDQVYYAVKRTINGSTVRYLEKWAKETECRGGTLNKQADAFITYSGASTSLITGLGHLEGQNVVVWADGADVGTDDSVVPWVQNYTVTGGQIILTSAVSNAVVGLGYTAQWKSTKLGLYNATQTDTPLNKQKMVKHLGLQLAYVHPKGIQYGPDFDTLQDMPQIEAGTTVDADTIRQAYDEQSFEFPGRWLTDSRLCLQSQAPRPCTVLGAVPEVNIP